MMGNRTRQKHRRMASKLMLSLGVVSLLFSALLLYQAYFVTERHFRSTVERQAAMALKFDLAIRTYVGQQIRPLMYELMGRDEFVTHAMSTSYVARRIFEDVRSEFPDYIIKFSSDNPRNPANQAGPEELRIIEWFNRNPGRRRWSGPITIDGRQYMANHFSDAVGEAGTATVTPIRIRRRDEIGLLADSFNRLSERLQVSYDQLEQKVHERTRALESANVALTQEIAERRRAEEALRLTQFAVEHSSDAAFRIEPDGRLRYVNEAACDLLGYPREELLRMAVHDIDTSFPRATWTESWAVIRSKGSVLMESDHWTRNGDLHPVEIRANYLEFGGNAYICAFVRDIAPRKSAETERQRLEDRLQRARKMEALGTLAGGVATT